MTKPLVDAQSAVLGYEGLDGVLRRTRLEFSVAPTKISAHEALFDVVLEAGQETSFFLTVFAEAGETGTARPDYARAAELLAAEFQAPKLRSARITSSNELLNNWLRRSENDLLMLTSQTPYGPYPYAGVPWSARRLDATGSLPPGVPDPRHGLGPRRPGAARLDPGPPTRSLAGRGARQDPSREPPRRNGDPRRGPLRLLLRQRRQHTPVRYAGPPVLRAIRRTASSWNRSGQTWKWPSNGSRPTATPTATASWSMPRQSGKGLVQQGWKDSNDAVFHADGALAEPPLRCARCKATSTRRSERRRNWPPPWGIRNGPDSSCTRRRPCGSDSRTPSGARTSPPTPWPWTAKSGRAPCALPTPGSASSRGSSAPIARPRTAHTLLGDDSFCGFRNSDRGRGTIPLQPHVVSQRLGLAARQRPHCRRHGAVRADGRGACCTGGDVRCEPVRRHAPHAGTVLRVYAPQPGRADPLSRCLPRRHGPLPACSSSSSRAWG